MGVFNLQFSLVLFDTVFMSRHRQRVLASVLSINFTFYHIFNLKQQQHLSLLFFAFDSLFISWKWVLRNVLCLSMATHQVFGDCICIFTCRVKDDFFRYRVDLPLNCLLLALRLFCETQSVVHSFVPFIKLTNSIILRKKFPKVGSKQCDQI